jgi:hypothetical protein
MNVSALSRSSNESLDYGHPLGFGYFLTPDAGDPRGVLEMARLVDGLGYDLIGVQDHPYQARHLDTSSMLATILAQTAAARGSRTLASEETAFLLACSRQRGTGKLAKSGVADVPTRDDDTNAAAGVDLASE